ncbi:unnamed protein product [Rotaria socialis]|uniref:Uncharacterized protein n=1 Tax=Rotaria socialis TaxID=392032 RepID=A0A818BL75_9BILA|nr:unnamed protein product [Rotaria socialis]CAF4378806.1 unnamed protein product [Rotaria socialis]
MKIFFCLLSFITCHYLGESHQPYFPSQIVFSPDSGRTVIAIDEINQKAFKTSAYGSKGQENSYVTKHFPYSIPDSPQSKYYVQLLVDSPPLGCMYGTYWKYGGNVFNSFPSHWLNGSSFKIENYIKYPYEMIHSMSSSQDEDYWYANVTCRTDPGNIYPCEEIYFKKDTEIPLRSTKVIRQGWNVVQVTTPYEIISIGKPDDKYFDSIPENWSSICRDVMLGLLYYPQSTKIMLNEAVQIQVWLSTPPHQINGNSTARIQWKSAQYNDCFILTPKELSFDNENFYERQTLTITRVKDGPQTNLIPIFNGGGFDAVPAQIYPIIIA